MSTWAVWRQRIGGTQRQLVGVYRSFDEAFTAAPLYADGFRVVVIGKLRGRRRAA